MIIVGDHCLFAFALRHSLHGAVVFDSLRMHLYGPVPRLQLSWIVLKEIQFLTGFEPWTLGLAVMLVAFETLLEPGRSLRSVYFCLFENMKGLKCSYC